MSRFDRYLLSQLLALFGFFSLVLVAIYWVNRAVGLFDELIGGGQTALVFLEFSLLTLPNVIRLVLPVSAFAAAVFVANRLTQDSELVVMQATGFSSVRLARPALVFGLIAAAMMLILTNVLVPASRTILADRTAEISANVTSSLLSDGRFLHPAKGLTIYIRDISKTGELRDLFLSDDRDPENRTIYTARKALLVPGAEGPKLIMLKGMSQSYSPGSGRLAVTRFEDFTYDLSGLLSAKTRRGRAMEQLSTRELLSTSEAVLKETRASRAEMLLEAHSRIAQPFLAAASAMIGFSALLVGAFSRFGLWRQIVGAVAMLILVQLVNTAAVGVALGDDRGWPAIYAAPVIGMAMSAVLLWWSQRPRRVAAQGSGAPG